MCAPVWFLRVLLSIHRMLCLRLYLLASRDPYMWIYVVAFLQIDRIASHADRQMHMQSIFLDELLYNESTFCIIVIFFTLLRATVAKGHTWIKMHSTLLHPLYIMQALFIPYMYRLSSYFWPGSQVYYFLLYQRYIRAHIHAGASSTYAIFQI